MAPATPRGRDVALPGQCWPAGEGPGEAALVSGLEILSPVLAPQRSPAGSCRGAREGTNGKAVLELKAA